MTQTDNIHIKLRHVKFNITQIGFSLCFYMLVNPQVSQYLHRPNLNSTLTVILKSFGLVTHRSGEGRSTPKSFLPNTKGRGKRNREEGITNACVRITCVCGGERDRDHPSRGRATLPNPCTRYNDPAARSAQDPWERPPIPAPRPWSAVGRTQGPAVAGPSRTPIPARVAASWACFPSEEGRGDQGRARLQGAGR